MMLYRGIEVTYEPWRALDAEGTVLNVLLRHKGLNNRAENSHQPTGVRERQMRRFKSLGQQRFLSAFEPIRGHFHPKQHELSAQRYREQLRQRFEEWREIACVKIAV